MCGSADLTEPTASVPLGWASGAITLALIVAGGSVALSHLGIVCAFAFKVASAALLAVLNDPTFGHVVILIIITLIVSLFLPPPFGANLRSWLGRTIGKALGYAWQGTVKLAAWSYRTLLACVVGEQKRG